MSTSNCSALTNASLPSNCTTESSSFTGYRESEALVWLRLFAYAVIFISGVGGNLLVILTIRRPHMKTVTNVFITNLAVADFLVCLLNVPMVTTLGHLGYWPFGEFMCKFLSFFQGVSLSASVGTLVAVAADRFKMVVLYQKPNTKIYQAYISVALIWISSIGLPFPLLIFSHIIYDAIGRDQCVEIWPNTSSRKLYTLFVAIFLYFIPLGAISMLYSRIVKKLWSLAESQKVKYEDFEVYVNELKRVGLKAKYSQTFRKMIENVCTTLGQQSENFQKPSKIFGRSFMLRQKRIVRMLVIVVVLFAVCWLPYHILFLYMDFGQPRITYDITSAIMSTQWFIYSNSTCNPIVYAVFNANYRREFSRMLRCRRKTRRAVKTNQTEMGRKDVEKNISFTDSCVDDSVASNSCVSTTAI